MRRDGNDGVGQDGATEPGHECDPQAGADECEMGVELHGDV